MMTGSRASKYSISSHAGTASEEHDCAADLPIIFRPKLMVAGVKEVMEALVSFSTCLDVISGDSVEFKSRFFRIFQILSTKYSLNLSARFTSESQSGSSVFFF